MKPGLVVVVLFICLPLQEVQQRDKKLSLLFESLDDCELSPRYCISNISCVIYNIVH